MTANPSCIIPPNEKSLGLMMGRSIHIEYEGKVTPRSMWIAIPKGFARIESEVGLVADCPDRSNVVFLLKYIRRCWSPDWPEVHRADVAASLAQERAGIVKNIAGTKVLMRWLAVAVLCSIGGCFFSNANITPASVNVSGYTRRDGTRVSSYSRRPSGSRAHDAPYELLRRICVIVFLGSAGWGWLAYCQLGRLKEQADRLPAQPPG